MRSEPELRALSEHLLYEIEMLFRAGGWLSSDGLPWEIEMALLESFTVHARALIDFLWRDSSRHQDDGFAAHYFEPEEWAKLRRPMEPTLNGIRDRVGEEIVHLSYARMRLPEDVKGWEFDQISASIGRCLRLFLEHVEPRLLIPDFERRARKAMPAFLSYPAAISWPPTEGTPSAATRSNPEASSFGSKTRTSR